MGYLKQPNGGDSNFYGRGKLMAVMKFDLPLLCMVTDRHRCGGRQIEEVVDDAVCGGVDLVQLREKDLPANQLFGLAQRCREITRERALFFVNDRLDVALAVGADGVQLGEHGLPVWVVRQQVESRLLVGRSVHTVAGGIMAESQGADLLLAGSIFPTTSHPDKQVQGSAFLKQLARSVSIPTLAIGGIGLENIEAVIDGGASGVAVVTAISESDDPTDASCRIMKLVQEAWDDRPAV